MTSRLYKHGSAGALLVYILCHIFLFVYFHMFSSRIFGYALVISLILLRLNKSKLAEAPTKRTPSPPLSKEDSSPKRPPIGTRHPSWFLREWAGFENIDEDAAPYGETSSIIPQRMRTTVIRFILLVLAAGTPYYIYFLTTWMWAVFGYFGLLFALAEVSR